MTADKEKNPVNSGRDGASEEEVRKESSKVAKQAAEAQDKATELMQAAAAGGDPEERQKLMEQALEQQIQSKSLGKTAKYLRSGTFQGMAVGAGLGIAPGASLGAITGTLVGGVTSTALGGLGAGIGAATGALHGPFWDMGKGAGKGIQKITGILPGWKATESQKKQLEKMVGQINEQDAPGKDELESWGGESLSEDQKDALEKAQSKLSAMPSGTQESDRDGGQAITPGKVGKEENPETEQTGSEGEKGTADSTKQTTDRIEDHDGATEVRDEPRDESQDEQQGETQMGHAQETKSTYKDVGVQTEKEVRKKPRKLRANSHNGNAPPTRPGGYRKQPRKLEKRSI